MKTTKTIARIAGVVLAGMMLLTATGCNEKKGGAAAAGALTKAQQKLLKAKPAPEGDFEIELSKDGSYVSIRDYLGKPVPTLVIPATIQGMPVKDVFIWDNKEKAAATVSVVIPEGVECVSSMKLPNVVTVVLPSTIKIIKSRAFKDCEKLTSISLPEGLLVIGEDAFKNTGLTSVSLPKSLKVLGLEAFFECNSLAEINIPEGLSVISEYNQKVSGSYYNGELTLSAPGKYDYPGTEYSFDIIFDGQSINKSVALQKLLKDKKSTKIDLTTFDEKYRNSDYTKWDW